MCSQRVKGFKLLLVLKFWRIFPFCPFLSNCWNHPFHHLFRLKEIQPEFNYLDIAAPWMVDVFLPKVCTLHSVSPLHLAATTSKVRVFQRAFLFFLCFFGFCLYVEQVEGLLDCYDDLIYKCFGQKIFLKISFRELFLLRPLDFNRQSSLKQYLMSYSSSSFQLVTLEFWLSNFLSIRKGYRSTILNDILGFVS